MNLGRYFRAVSPPVLGTHQLKAEKLKLFPVAWFFQLSLTQLRIFFSVHFRSEQKYFSSYSRKAFVRLHFVSTKSMKYINSHVKMKFFSDRTVQQVLETCEFELSVPCYNIYEGHLCSNLTYKKIKSGSSCA